MSLDDPLLHNRGAEPDFYSPAPIDPPYNYASLSVLIDAGVESRDDLLPLLPLLLPLHYHTWTGLSSTQAEAVAAVHTSSSVRVLKGDFSCPQCDP